MSQFVAPDRRRQLDDTQWLEAMGLDPFWIANPVTNNQVAQVSGSAALVANPVTPVGGAELTGPRRWEMLNSAIRDCRTCALCEGRRQAVAGSGDQQATWLIVGEAPGAEEDQRGQPFVGRAGQLLDAMLAALGLNRQKAVYITNAVKCRPPENRSPESAEIAACNHFLREQVRAIQPGVILALGKSAAHALLGHEATVQSLRGVRHIYTQEGLSIPVVVTYHPAYLLRQPEEKPKAWADLLLAASALHTE